MADGGLRYLDNSTVLRVLRDIDLLEVIRGALRDHVSGRVILPDEAALRWPVGPGEEARSLALPASLEGPPRQAGVKVINANPANVGRGLNRASGLLLLFEPVTARIVGVLQAEHVSSRRTAGVTAAALTAFAPSARTLTLIGAGPLALAHLEVCAPVLPLLQEIRVFDRDRRRAESFRSEGSRKLDVPVLVAEDVEAAVRGADAVIPVTTTTEPYLEHRWLATDATVVNVSLDDCHAEVFEQAGLLVVDSWDLVAGDDRRLLGRLARAGRVTGPRDERRSAAKPVDGELGAYVDVSFDRPPGTCVVNPFGMGIADVALGSAVYDEAVDQGLGVILGV